MNYKVGKIGLGVLLKAQCLSLAAVVFFGLSCTSSLNAAIVFQNASNNSGVADALADELEVIVSDNNDGTVTFRFKWADSFTDTEPSIMQIDVFDGIFATSPIAVTESSGVVYKDPALGGVLNGSYKDGQYADVPTGFTPTFLLEAVKDGANSNSIQAGEWLDLTLTITDGQFSTVEEAIANNVLFFGVHVGSIGDSSDSDWFLSGGGGEIPEPASVAVWGLLGVIGLAAGMRRRFRKSA